MAKILDIKIPPLSTIWRSHKDSTTNAKKFNVCYINLLISSTLSIFATFEKGDFILLKHTLLFYFSPPVNLNLPILIVPSSANPGDLKRIFLSLTRQLKHFTLSIYNVVCKHFSGPLFPRTSNLCKCENKKSKQIFPRLWLQSISVFVKTCASIALRHVASTIDASLRKYLANNHLLNISHIVILRETFAVCT